MKRTMNLESLTVKSFTTSLKKQVVAGMAAMKAENGNTSGDDRVTCCTA